ncbi:protein nap1 [Quercus suber]|uniref:Protein nap1 n=1 Tax=Quercus suber TaxID=58331 RepID=A0AAW0KET1_QUESU
MVLQIYNLLHAMSNNDRDCDFYHRLVQFIDSYDPPLKGLQEDLNFVSPRIGEPHQNSLILHAFMDLFCSFVRVNLFSEKASQLSIVFHLSVFNFLPVYPSLKSPLVETF